MAGTFNSYRGFGKNLLNKLGLREDSVAVLEAEMADAGLSDADLATLDPRAVERLRQVAIRTEAADALQVLQQRLGASLTADEKKVITQVVEGVVKRSGRLGQIVAELQQTGRRQSDAQVQALQAQVTAQNDALSQLSALLAGVAAGQQAIASGQVAILQNQQQAPQAPQAATPNVTFRKNADGTYTGSDGKQYVMLGGQMAMIDDEASSATPAPANAVAPVPPGA